MGGMMTSMWAFIVGGAVSTYCALENRRAGGMSQPKSTESPYVNDSVSIYVVESQWCKHF